MQVPDTRYARSGDLRIGFEDLVRSGSGSDDDFQDVVLTVDGQDRFELAGGDVVEVLRARTSVVLVRSPMMRMERSWRADSAV